jgi:hypothetical protein
MMHRRLMINKLQAYRDGALSTRERAALQSHLKHCESCANILREMEQTDTLFVSARREPAPLSRDKANILFQRAMAEAASVQKPAPRNNLHFGWALAVAGAFAIAGLVTYRTMVQPVTGTAPKNIAAVQGVEKPQHRNEIKTPVIANKPPLKALGSSQPEKAQIAENPAPRHGHRKTPALPQPSNMQMASAENVTNNPDANRQDEELTAPPQESSRGRMMVIVRRGESEPALRPTPAVKVTVSRDPELKTGFARAAAYHADGNGSVAWTQCTVTSGGSDSSSRTETLTTGLNRPASILKVERTDTGHLKPQEDQP